MKKIITLAISVFLPISAYSHKDENAYINDTLKCSHGQYNIYNSDIIILDYKDLPYNQGVTSIRKESIISNTINAFNNSNKHSKNININKKGENYYDDNSNHLFNYKGKLVYHPVAMASGGLVKLKQYNTSGNIKKLEEVKK